MPRLAYRMGMRPSVPGAMPGYRGAGANNWIGGLAAVTVGMVIVLGDLLDGPQVRLVGLLAIVPLIAANFLRPVPTVITGLLFSTGMTVLVGVSIQIVEPSAQTVRVVATVVVSWFAGAVSYYRCQNAVRIEKLTAVAAASQYAVLEPLPERMGKVVMSAAYRSAADESTVGGDFYAAVPGATRCTQGGGSGSEGSAEVCVLLGDVRGKGLPAVRLTNRILGGFRHVAGRLPDQEMLRQLDEVVAAVGGDEDFATAVLVVACQGEREGQLKVTTYNAGHLPPLLVRRAGGVQVSEVKHPDLDLVSLPLGLGADPVAVPVQMDRGDLLLLYTDGVTETRRRGQFFPLATTLASVAEEAVEPADVVAALSRHISAWSDRPLSDDVAMLALSPA